MTGQPAEVMVDAVEYMPSIFIGCTGCRKILVVLSEADAHKRALASGWQFSNENWLCPDHVVDPSKEAPEPLAVPPARS